MTRHTDNIEEASRTPGRRNRTVRMKYSTAGEVLSEYLDSNSRIGRLKCPVCDYLKAHLDEDVMAVEDVIYGEPDWAAPVICESIQGTRRYNNQATHPYGDMIAEAVQHDMALELLGHSWDRARRPFSTMLKHPDTKFMSGAVAYIVLSYLNAHHPNPRRFLEKPEVRAKFPADLEIARFAAPDFDAAA